MDTTNLHGKTVVITGGTSGLGQAAVISFAKEGAKVLVVGRDAERGAETVREAGPNAELILGDVSTRAGVKKVAAEILKRVKKLDVLLNNAGGSFKSPSKTSEGIETTFALNTLGAYLLERELHGVLSAARGRVVNVATGFLDNYPVDLGDLLEPKKYSGLAQYGRSKNASVMMSVEQAKRFEGEGVTVASVHPGIIMGTRFNGGQPKVVQVLAGGLMRLVGLGCTLDEAVRRFRVACFDPLPSGAYVVKGKPAPLPKQANEAPVRAQVMQLLEKLATA